MLNNIVILYIKSFIVKESPLYNETQNEMLRQK